MKKLTYAYLILSLAIIQSCNKEDPSNTNNAPCDSNSSTSDSYSSTSDFFVKNQLPIQSYTIDGSAGGSFTTAQGTIVTVPPNAFKTLSGAMISGNVTIKFKDLYKKSDMLLDNMPTSSIWGIPLKSGGEFFIKAMKDNSVAILANGKRILVQQPVALTGGLDTAMLEEPFVMRQDSIGGIGWIPSPIDSIYYAAGAYIFSLYEFNPQSDSGSWCNSDNPSFFFSYPQTTLTLHPTNAINEYGTTVFLLFNNISSMVSVYSDNVNFNYYFAPEGLQCTLVAVGVKNGNLYSAFVPITITSNLTVNFTLTQTTTTDFKATLNSLN
jgi:hypothetical protein